MAKANENEGLTQNDKIKIGVAGGVFLIAVVFIAQSMGWITLWGDSTTKQVEKPPTPQQAEERKKIIKQIEQDKIETSKAPNAVKGS